MPGKTNHAADAASRYPSSYSELASSSLLSTIDLDEVAFNSALSHDASDLMSISWNEVVDESCRDETLFVLKDVMKKGFPNTIQSLPDCIKPFWNLREALSLTEDGVVLYGDRVVIPKLLQERALEVLHAAHQGASGMEARAQTVVFWPGISSDIQRVRIECSICCKNAPSQSKLPASVPDIPSTPFESVFADFFDVSNHRYLVAGDRLSGWVEVFSAQTGSKSAGSSGLISHLQSLFAIFGVPHTLSSDGGPEFVSSATDDFLKCWGINHRISSAYYPQSNGRAEVPVKKIKRFLISCHDPKSGSLNTDQLLCGMLQLRNTPDPDCKVSPAQILFGRPLRDAFSFINRNVKFSTPYVEDSMESQRGSPANKICQVIREQ